MHSKLCLLKNADTNCHGLILLNFKIYRWLWNDTGLLIQIFFFNKYLWLLSIHSWEPVGTENRMYTLLLHHFIQGTWASVDFGIHRGSWEQSLVHTQAQLSFCGVKRYTLVFNCMGIGTPNLYIVQGSTIFWSFALFLIYSLTLTVFFDHGLWNKNILHLHSSLILRKVQTPFSRMPYNMHLLEGMLEEKTLSTPKGKLPTGLK